MARTIKQLLPAVETEIFYNWNDFIGAEVKAVNITLCNVTASAVDVWWSFCVISGVFSAGLVLNKATVPANDTITIEITERVINTDESIRAFASVANAIALSIDLVGDIEPEGEEVLSPP